MKKRLLLAAVCFALLAGDISAQVSAEVKNILSNVSADAIKGHMSFLADDLLEGRLPGTRGFALASKFMETEFVALGLKPVLSDSSYIQQVPLKKGWIDETECSFVISDKNNKTEKLEYGKEFLLSPYFAAAQSNVSAALVFVGFGISAPEFFPLEPPPPGE